MGIMSRRRQALEIKRVGETHPTETKASETKFDKPGETITPQDLAPSVPVPEVKAQGARNGANRSRKN